MKKRGKRAPKSMHKAVKIELRLNGELLCRAATSKSPQFVRAGIEYSSERQTVALEVKSVPEPPVWLQTLLRRDDEISIRLVDVGDPTEPVGLYARPSESEGGKIVTFKRRDSNSI